MADDALAVNHYSVVKSPEKARFSRFTQPEANPSYRYAISTRIEGKKTCKFKVLAVAVITCSEVSRLLRALLE